MASRDQYFSLVPRCGNHNTRGRALSHWTER
ncbi:hypothetical protein LINPERHAP1_LOCUS20 [Linum perenne]